MMAAAKDDLDIIGNEFAAVIAAIHQDGSDLAHLFSDPAFSPPQKKAVIKRLAEHYKLNTVFEHFLCVLVDKDRLRVLPLIYEAFVALLDTHHGRMRAHIKSATAVDDGLVADITSALKKICKKEILADVAIDKSLLAGLRVEIGGMVIDGSAKANCSP
jgi:F-type H+-transporting ATPase subunit delta